MRDKRFGSIGFVLFFIAALLLLARILPYNNSQDHLLNHILPLGGAIFGQEPEVWVADTSDGRLFGKGKQNRPPSLDIDFIKVQGQWYKIKGPVYLTKSGKILGWHQPTVFEESRFFKRTIGDSRGF